MKRVVIFMNNSSNFLSSNKETPDDNHRRKMVNAEAQQKEIDALKKTLHYEKFFFVYNDENRVIEQAAGVSHWLGYPDEEFTLQKFYAIIHPSHLLAKLIVMEELLHDFVTGKRAVGFMGYSISNILALQHLNGDFKLFKCLSWPFQHDNKYRPLSYLSEFTLLGPFKNEPYQARLNDYDHKICRCNEDVRDRSALVFKCNGPFSNQEINILCAFANDPGIRGAEIARILHVKESTVITYKKRIINKAENLFRQRFETAKHAALYLRECGLI